MKTGVDLWRATVVKDLLFLNIYSGRGFDLDGSLKMEPCFGWMVKEGKKSRCLVVAIGDSKFRHGVGDS